MFPEIFLYSENKGAAAKRKRRIRINETAPKQKDLNNKRAKRYFIWLANGNFGMSDLVVHLSYSDEYCPVSLEEAIRIVGNYLRRVAYERKRRGLPALKYLLVTQVGRKKNGTHRIHHHIIMNGGLDRDFVENLWWVIKGTKRNDYEDRILYGWANADRLRPNRIGITQLSAYLMKDSLGKKHWTQSQNLEKPWFRGKNDRKYTPRQIERICKIPSDSEDYKMFWKKQYPDYEYIDSEREYSDENGWSVHLMMRRRC